ncbi:hypothetical protein ACHAXS_011161 [Conticribra weissflogii]
MKSPMVNVTRFTMLCLWPTVMSAHAFASTSTAILAPATSSSLSLRRHGPLAPFHGHNANEIYGRNLNNKFTHDNIKYNRRSSSSGSSLHLHPAKAKAIAELIPRGGASASAAIAGVGATLSQWSSTPNGAFNMALAVLAASTAVLKIGNRESGEGGADGAAVTGPYFYQVYATKSFGSAANSAMTWVSRLFLTGFASTALFGPLVGRLCDSYGRKAGTLAFSLLYSLGAYSTKSNLLGVLLMGRVLGGIGTSLLFSAPEAWLVGEAGKEGVESSLGETFGLAYAGDSIVAILAGQLASLAASSRGPTGPFEMSVGFLILGGLLASMTWKENVAGGGDDGGSKPTIRDAVKVVKSDPKIMLVGAMQSLFEAAMYVFVLNWPPAVSKAVGSYFSKFATDASTAISTPYGTVFSCFMACCLLGSTIFGQLTSSKKVDKNGKSKAISTENFAVGMLGLATIAMGSATLSITGKLPKFLSFLSSPGSLLSILVSSLFVFESCVGMYFPTIGTLRSKYFPDSHRSVVMNLFGIPLNAMVVTVFLSIEKLGTQGALGVSTTALALATLCGLKLKSLMNDEGDDSKK